MQSRIVKIVICIFSFSLNAFAELAFDASTVSKEKKEIVKKDNIVPEQLSKSKAVTKNFSLGNVNVELDEYKITKTLKQFDLILTKEKKEENIFSIELNRIVCFLQLARINRIKSGGRVMNKDEEEFLKKAVFKIDSLLEKTWITAEARGQLKYFKGIALVDLGMKEISRNSFEEAVTISPNATFVPSLGLYLSDLLYDENNLDKAFISYKKFYEKLSPQEKDLADYKMAWIYLNQSKIDSALFLFIKLIQSSKSNSIVQDSILSLVVACSDKFGQEDILNKVDEIKTSEENKLKILQSIYDIFLKSPTRGRRKIWERLIKFETRPDEVTKLLSNEISFLEFKEKLAGDSDMLNFISNYLKLNIDKIKGFNPINLTALGQDLEELIAKTFANYQKNKNEKNYINLRTTIFNYLMFNSFKRQADVGALYYELLSEKNENETLVNFCYEILKNPIYVKLKDKAKLSILLDVERKYLKDPKKNQERFFGLVRVYLKNPKMDQWLSVALKFYDYLIKASLFLEAEEMIETINKSNPSEATFFKIITVKFELKKCSEILTLLKDKQNLNPELTNYKRECFLTTAKDSKKDTSSFANYQRNIQEFISLAEGPKKTAAIIDYLNSYEKILFNTSGAVPNPSVNYKEYETMLDKQYFNQRFEKEYFPFFQREIDRLVDAGSFSRALFYLENCESNVVCKENVVLKSKIKQMMEIDELNLANNLNSINLEANIINYISLISPELILEKALKADSKIDKRIILVSSRLSEVNWSEPQNKALYEKMESTLSNDEILLATINSWKLLNNINFPEVTTKKRMKDQDSLLYMKRVQKTRQGLVNDLNKLSLESQKKLLLKAFEIENKMAEIINLSPIPKNLDPSKKADYEQAIKQLADEFVKQSESYQKTLVGLDAQIEIKKKENEAIATLEAPVNEDEWSYGKNPIQILSLKTFLKKNYFYQSLFYIDYLNSVSKIEKEDYYLTRAGILLLASVRRKKIFPMVNYVKSELENSKQTKVLSFWNEWRKR